MQNIGEKILKMVEGKFLLWLLVYHIYVYGFNNYPQYYININILISNFLLGMLVLSFAFSFRKISKILIGDIDVSYGLYLYHMLFLNYFIYKYGVEGTKERILYYILLTFLTAFLSDKFLEKPTLDYIKSKFRGK